jgi:hypothetical protein
MSSGIITTYLTMRRDSRLVVTGRPRERRASHALCVKHPTARTVFRPALAALWQKVALVSYPLCKNTTR